MKLVFGFLCLALLLGIYLCTPLSVEEDTRKPVDLSYICMHVLTSEGKRNDNAPILLLHGLLGFKELWYGFMQLLAVKTGRRVCAADLRNHGDSPWSDEFDTKVLAKDVKQLLETLKIEKVILLGHSLGGKTAVHFALTYPEKVAKLIIEDMRPNGLRDDQTLREAIDFKDIAEVGLKAIPEGANEKDARRAVFLAFKEMLKQMNDTFELEDAIVAYHFPIKCSNGKCSWKSNMARLAKAAKDIVATIPHSHGEYHGPTLFIHGSESPFRVGDVAEEIFELFPKAEICSIKGANHVVNTFPEYKDKVLEFILE